MFLTYHLKVKKANSFCKKQNYSFAFTPGNVLQCLEFKTRFSSSAEEILFLTDAAGYFPAKSRLSR